METESAIHSVKGHMLGDVSLAKRAADMLNKHYPGHLWAVFVDTETTGGILVIRNLAISFNYGCVLHLSTVNNDPDLRCVMRAGGELLERARMKRGWWNGRQPTHIEGVPDKDQPLLLPGGPLNR